jgi:type VII secretion protein EccE
MCPALRRWCAVGFPNSMPRRWCAGSRRRRKARPSRRADWIRVTNRDSGADGTTWIGLTLDAADNLAALQARSAEIPLQETAETVIRRLRDHLREFGFDTSVVERADVPRCLRGRRRGAVCAQVRGIWPRTASPSTASLARRCRRRGRTHPVKPGPRWKCRAPQRNPRWPRHVPCSRRSGPRTHPCR